MIKYLFLAVCTMVAILIKDYAAGLGIYVVGLILYEAWVIASIIKKRKKWMKNLLGYAITIASYKY